MTANDYTESLLPSSSNNYSNNYHSLDNNSYHHHHLNPMNYLKNDKKEQDAENYHQYTDSHSPLMSRVPSEESLITQQSTAISMVSSGSIPTNTNVISALRQRATSTAKPRVDNVFLYRSIPKFGDMFLDHKTSAITLLHTGFALLTIILIVLGYSLHIESSWRFGTFLCLITNIFGITHSMYSGSIHSQLGRLDAALQNFAVIIQKFAKALNIQEAYLCSVKNILDFLDHHILLIEHQHPDIVDDIDATDYKKAALLYHEFFERIKGQTVIQHRKWLLTFFGQYKLLDNRFGITKIEYLDFIRKLPNKSRTLFQSLTGIHKRFKLLNTQDELIGAPIDLKPKEKQRIIEKEQYESKDVEEVEMCANGRKTSIGMDINKGYKTTSVLSSELGDNAVLLYKDMTDLVYKVLEDIGVMNKRIQKELAYKMLSFEREKERIRSPSRHAPDGSFILSKRMSVSLAHDAPNVTIGKKKKGDEYQRIDNDDDDEDEAKSCTLHEVQSVSDNQRSAPLLSKIRTYEGMDIVKQRTLSIDDDWLKKVMNDLNDDDDTNYYDYSQSHVSYKL